MTKAELNAIGIKQWSDIRSNYQNPDLFLGNGFSISLSLKFHYQSLFDSFIQKTKEPEKSLFKQFQTTNFELILNYLNHALRVNTILQLPISQINQAIEALKNGLIDAIKENHPRIAEIDQDKLNTFTDELRDYGNIYTTNYDLFLYHIIMKSIDRYKLNNSYPPYQDYFWGTNFTQYRECMYFQNYPHYKHVYYLHGALFIFNQGVHDLKIIRSGSVTELVDIIADEIGKGNFPLFVTEGSADDKLSSIYRSRYLNFCLQKLASVNTPLLIFGNSLSDFDSHIVEQLKNNPRELIIALYTVGLNINQIQELKYKIRNKFPELKYKPKIEFVDSSSVFNI